MLKSANLERAVLRDADLSRVDLEFASLRNADLTNDASLRGAALGGANLTGATVAGADFLAAELASARLVAPIGLGSPRTSTRHRILSGCCANEMRVCAAPDIQGAIARPRNTRSGLATGSRSEPSESQRREYLRSTDAPESARQPSLRGAQLPHLRNHRSRIDNRHRRLITPRASSAASASTHHECIHHRPPSIERCGIEKPHHRHRRLLRARRERPRDRRATKQPDELAPPCMSRKEHCEG